MTKELTFGKRVVGAGHPAFVIAEAGVNHNGKLDLAFQLVDAAITARADAVKFQTFIASEVLTAGAAKAEYQKTTTGEQESQLEMVRRLELSFGDFRKLKMYCDDQGITFLSTPFDFKSVDFLEGLGVVAFKISSGDLTNDPLLRHVAAKGRPVILSTGMSDMDEVRDALAVIQAAGNNDVILLQCVTNYPAAAEDINLKAMLSMQKAFDVNVGYSDHTLGIEVALAAVALGACVIEKHFTLDKNFAGPDHRASLEPHEFKAMVDGIRTVEASLGNGQKVPAASEAGNATVARRSIVAARDIKTGTLITSAEIAFKRPGTGLPPRMVDQVVGKTARVDVTAGSLLELEMFE
ncbi:MAG TPA: N-acetylneuraminate synthase [Pyrinomonadaceae bacterium]|nr:N-acetylneuraminate synthase [Pyrinomonadaceae bacterium]